MSVSSQIPPDTHWQALMDEAQQWLSSPIGQLLLSQQGALLEAEMGRLFGGYMLSYGPAVQVTPNAAHIKQHVRIGPKLAGVQVLCEEHAWPLAEHSVDAVVLQHALDFSLSPHALLREAARAVRPGGHLLLVGVHPWSAWGARSWLGRDTLGRARCMSPERAADWLSLLGFALEKRRFGCYRPPLASPRWQQRLNFLEQLGCNWQLPGAGFYLLVARKLSVGLRPVRPARRESMGKLLPMPVAKVSRRDTPP